MRLRRLAPLLVVAALAGCGGHSAQKVPPGAIAVVGDRAVPRAALDAELVRSRRAYQARGQAFPARGTTAYRRLEDAAVRLVVDRARLEVEAKRAGIVIPDSRVDAGLRRLRDTTFGGDVARYRAQLAMTGMTDADVREAIRTQLLADALRGRHIQPAAVVYAPGFEP